MKYKEYLKSDRWKTQRRRTFYHHGRKCVVCGNDKVEVHHLTYKMLENENPSKHLLPLCREHHQMVHDYSKLHKMSIWDATHLLTIEYRSKLNPRGLTWDQMTWYQREKFIGRGFTRYAYKVTQSSKRKTA